MSSQTLQIRDAVMARLEAALPGVTLLKSPRREIGEHELPALAVFSVSDRATGDEDCCRVHERGYTLRVEIRATGRPEEDATDALASSVRAALLDNELGGLTHRVLFTEQAWDGDEGESPLAGSYLDFSYFYLWRP